MLRLVVVFAGALSRLLRLGQADEQVAVSVCGQEVRGRCDLVLRRLTRLGWRGGVCLRPRFGRAPWGIAGLLVRLALLGLFLLPVAAHVELVDDLVCDVDGDGGGLSQR